MIRRDCNHKYWKKKSISGLLTLFAEKARTKLKDRFQGKFSYNQLTCGDLISFINITRLEFCTNMKLKNQLKEIVKYHKKKLGSFCEDFGYIKLSAPSKEASKRIKKRATYKNNYIYRVNEYQYL